MWKYELVNSKEGCNWGHGLSTAIKIRSVWNQTARIGAPMAADKPCPQWQPSLQVIVTLNDIWTSPENLHFFLYCFCLVNIEFKKPRMMLPTEKFWFFSFFIRHGIGITADLGCIMLTGSDNQFRKHEF